MFLLVVVLSVHMDRQYNDQKKHGQTIQRPKEKWTDNITTKRNMDRQYNDQKKHGQTIQRPKETFVVLFVYVSFGSCIVCLCFFWSLYCLSMFLLVVVLSVHASLGRCIGQTMQRPKETWRGNTTTKRNMDRQNNDQKKHGQAIQRPKETWTGNTTTKRNMDSIVCLCFFW
jgi:hypothetical protein